MRSTYLIGLVAGCGFSSMPASGGGSGGPEGVDAGTGVASGQCDLQDAKLRLCLSFDQTAAMVQDLVTPPHVLMDHIGVSSILGLLSTPTARFDSASRIRFAESNDLDVSDLTIEMWIKPDPLQSSQHYWMLDNNTQYYAVLDGDGSVRCGIGGSTSISSQAHITGASWHHIACSFTSSDRVLRVHVDGDVSGCTTSGGQIPTTGLDGLAIGANYGAGSFTENFVGGIDGVHVYARALRADEICKAANRTGCNTQCQTQDEGPSDPRGPR